MIKKITRYLIVLGMMTPISGAVMHQSVIRLKENAAVDGSIVRLNQIAEVRSMLADNEKRLGELILGETPRPGLFRYFNKYDIIRSLRRNQFDTRTVRFEGCEKTRVTQPGVIVTQSMIEERAKRFLYDHFDWNEEQTLVRMHNKLQDILLPLGEVDFRFRILSEGASMRRLVLVLDLIQEGRIQKSLNLGFQCTRFEKRWTAKRPLFKGERIASDDLELRRCEVKSFRPTGISEADDIVGKVALKNLKPGTIITDRMIGRPILIKRGMTVNVIVESGRLKISMHGKAMDSGHAGDRIRVKNSNTGRIITGVVKDNGNVMVR